MLFNSFAFIAGFVPAVLVASLIAGRAAPSRRGRRCSRMARASLLAHGAFAGLLAYALFCVFALNVDTADRRGEALPAIAGVAGALSSEPSGPDRPSACADAALRA
ncbi:MAG: hypothetical protein FJX36_04515 [Alphaproteobacteria bacterium]|nr:hypothetical protein [Alphaproteobacteria bacterium]